MTSLASVRTKASIAAEQSMAKQFVALCEHNGVPIPERQCRFHMAYRWRFDLAWPFPSVACSLYDITGRRIPCDPKLAGVALEVDGGLFVKGAHARGARIARTHDKLNAAAIAGWRILFVQPKQLLTLDTIRLVKQALGIA